jgi:L-ascorbate oxidase
MYVNASFASLLLLAGTSLASQVRKYNFTITLQWSSADGHGRPVFMINGQSPGPLIEADEGDEIEVFVDNQLGAETTMHWYVLMMIKKKNIAIQVLTQVTGMAYIR